MSNVLFSVLFALLTPLQMQVPNDNEIFVSPHYQIGESFGYGVDFGYRRYIDNFGFGLMGSYDELSNNRSPIGGGATLSWVFDPAWRIVPSTFILADVGTYEQDGNRKLIWHETTGLSLRCALWKFTVNLDLGLRVGNIPYFADADSHERTVRPYFYNSLGASFFF